MLLYLQPPTAYRLGGCHRLVMITLSLGIERARLVGSLSHFIAAWSEFSSQVNLYLRWVSGENPACVVVGKDENRAKS